MPKNTCKYILLCSCSLQSKLIPTHPLISLQIHSPFLIKQQTICQYDLHRETCLINMIENHFICRLSRTGCVSDTLGRKPSFFLFKFLSLVSFFFTVSATLIKILFGVDLVFNLNKFILLIRSICPAVHLSAH